MKPYQKEFGWHAVWSHEFIFPTVSEEMAPVIELVRGNLQTDYDYPTTIKPQADTRRRGREILAGLEGEALEEMRAANEINLKMAPLTPDHHFYIDQGANAHVRLVLTAIGEKLVALGVLDAPDDVVYFKYNESARLHGRPQAGRGTGSRCRAQGRAGEGIHVPPEGVDRDLHSDAARLPGT